MVIVLALAPIKGLTALASAGTGEYIMLSTSTFKAAEATVVFFYGFEPFTDAHGDKLLALVCPVG